MANVTEELDFLFHFMLIHINSHMRPVDASLGSTGMYTFCARMSVARLETFECDSGRPCSDGRALGAFL